jgi:hypothetical protein
VQEGSLIESARDNESPKRFTADIMMKRIFFIITSKYARELDPTIVLRLGSMSGEPPITPGSQKSHHRAGGQGFTGLHHLASKILNSTRSEGAVYACPDDIGAALKDIRGLIICAKLFEKFRLASGLTLKPTKCVAILVSLEASEVNLRAIRDMLIQHIPQWKNLRFAPLGKYLGIHIGPKLGGINWEAPMAKTFSRVEEILATKPPLVLACSTYNSRALPCLSWDM